MLLLSRAEGRGGDGYGVSGCCLPPPRAGDEKKIKILNRLCEGKGKRTVKRRYLCLLKEKKKNFLC